MGLSDRLRSWTANFKKSHYVWFLVISLILALVWNWAGSRFLDYLASRIEKPQEMIMEWIKLLPYIIWALIPLSLLLMIRDAWRQTSKGVFSKKMVEEFKEELRREGEEKRRMMGLPPRDSTL